VSTLHTIIFHSVTLIECGSHTPLYCSSVTVWLTGYIVSFCVNVSVSCTDWVLPVDGDQLKAKCKYCSHVMNARYLQLLRHSLSNKHLCNAAAAATISFAVDVDSYLSAEQSTTEDIEQTAGTDGDDDYQELVDESSDVEFNSTDVQQMYADASSVSFIADPLTSNTDGHKKVNHWL